MRVILLLLSIGLVGTWVYHFYDKAQYSNLSNDSFIKDSTTIANAVKDSLAKIYTAQLNQLDSKLDSSLINADSLKTSLDDKLEEIAKLKNEITAILKNKNLSKGDLGLARQKIGELQQKVDALSSQNNTVEQEKSQLSGKLQQLTTEIDGLQKNIRQLNDENKNLTEKVNAASIFIASELSLNAIENKRDSEEPTTNSKRADKFVVAFMVQSPIQDFINTEVVTVVIQPNGQVLQNSDWDAGNFETNKGMKPFTRKVKFDYTKGDQRRILFTLDNFTFQKGTYVFQLWHKGTLIGQTTRKLS